MAIVTMERIRLIAMRRDRKQILELLQRRGAVDVGDVEDVGDMDSVFTRTDNAATRQAFEKNIEVINRAVSLLDKTGNYKAPALAFLHGRQAKTPAECDRMDEKRHEDLQAAHRIVELEQAIAEANGQIVRAKIGLESLVPWMSLPVAQTFSGTKKTSVFIGLLEGEQQLQEIHQSMSSAMPQLDSLHIEIVSADKIQTCIMVIVPKRLTDITAEALRSIGFAHPHAASGLMPLEKKAQYEEQLSAAQETIRTAEAELKSVVSMREDLCYLQDSFEMRSEKYAVIERLAQSKHTFILSGYLPAANGQALEAELDEKFNCAVERTTADRPGGTTPVLLKNSSFSAPVEGIVESYSLPGDTDIDPTPVMGFFYYMMFGLMFGDAGYGLIMSIVCGYCLLHFKNMEPNWARNIRLFFLCGISTVFWGVIFSSYFGNVVDVVGETFFGVTVSIPPVWFYVEDKPMLMLVFCLGLGIAHLTTGYIMKGIADVKNGDKFGVFCDTVLPILLWYPLMALLANSDMFYNLAKIRLPLTPLLSQICTYLAGGALAGIILTGGRGTKNIALRLLQGVYAAYNALSGWLGDMLSYSRLLALGLASGVIASVMNQLGSMAGGGVAGVILFTAVFLAGHAMNFGINVLGAYVHSNRLEYIEFFGKFYEGGGRKFSPFGIHTKHYKIVEEAK